VAVAGVGARGDGAGAGDGLHRVHVDHVQQREIGRDEIAYGIHGGLPRAFVTQTTTFIGRQ
jgi:hypothetical protein